MFLSTMLVHVHLHSETPPNEPYMATTTPFINHMNVYVLTEIMAKKAIPTEKPFCALTKQISVVFENVFSAQHCHTPGLSVCVFLPMYFIDLVFPLV